MRPGLDVLDVGCGRRLTAPSMREVIQREGWVTRAEFDAMIAALDRWADRPDAFLSWLYCGALGWVP